MTDSIKCILVQQCSIDWYAISRFDIGDPHGGCQQVLLVLTIWEHKTTDYAKKFLSDISLLVFIDMLFIMWLAILLSYGGVYHVFYCISVNNQISITSQWEIVNGTG